MIGDNDIPIAVIDDINKEATGFKKLKLPRAFEALEKAGFKFTGYVER